MGGLPVHILATIVRRSIQSGAGTNITSPREINSYGGTDDSWGFGSEDAEEK